MEMARDRYRFVLDRPIVAEPGSRWESNGGTTALLGHLIAEGTGTSWPATTTHPTPGSCRPRS